MNRKARPLISSIQRKALRSWVVRVAACTLVVSSLGSALPVGAAPAADPGNPAVRSIVRLPATVLGGVRVAELSGLAWDADEKMLFAISDRGYLYRFRLHLENRHLKSVEPVDAVSLRWAALGRDRADAIDAEGLAIFKGENGVMGDAQLLVSTEGQPQVLRVSTVGQVNGSVALPKPLADARLYQAENAMLEALAHSPPHGLLTAAEAPLKGQPAGYHQIHADGKSWRFPMLDTGRSRLKAMEFLPDGSLVVLERARAGKGKGLVNALRRVQLSSCGGEVVCEVQELLFIDRTEGAENFEGMAHLGDMQFLLVSDNLGSKQTPSVFLLVDLQTHSGE